jgi:hypothetical protein
MSRRRAFAGYALAVVGAALLLSPAGGAIASLARQAVGDPPKPIAGPGDPSPALPVMTEEDRAQAVAVLAQDPMARGFLRGPYTIEKIGPWMTLDHEKLGVSMILKLDRPHDFGLVKWPLMNYDQTERSSPPFRTDLVPLTASNVTELAVQVDLVRDRLAGIEPSGNGVRITPGPGVVPTTRPHSD